uniref:Adrenomedullin 2 n=1 Tax=Fundulus heteroclitus TaxID=8078 RepID=A0A3Q2UHB4_FUNHE
MRFFLPLGVYCISLLSLQQLSASPAGERPDASRLSHPTTQEKEVTTPSEDQPSNAPTSPAANKLQKWLSSIQRHLPASGASASPGLTWEQLIEATRINRRAKRSHGHGHLRGGKNHSKHAQLKRVGCVLGTCQVQNLSHRLYQLIGQNGREESSPVNPRSPHSYG